MTTAARRSPPSKEAIALLPPFPRLGLDRIALVATAAEVQAAATALLDAARGMALPAWGFDTESKPTFHAGEVSDGPHVVQFATLQHAWVFQLHTAACREAVAALLLQPGIVKAGFGLGDDRRFIARKLGVDAPDVLDLNAAFVARGWKRDIGVKSAVAVLFGQRFQKSRKATTSNWANRVLSEAQLLYAANDAWAAALVHARLADIPD